MFNAVINPERNENPEKIDVAFVLLVLVFCGLGFITLFSGSYGYASRIFDDPFYFVKRQAVNFVAGIKEYSGKTFIQVDFCKREITCFLATGGNQYRKPCYDCRS